MRVKERQYAILKLLQEKKKLTITALTEQFNVSVITLRRDLNELEENGLIKKVYGGAVLVEQKEPYLLTQPYFSARMSINRPLKTAIAAAAAELVEPGDVIVLDIGTTCLETAKCLKNISNLTVLTSSLAVLNELSDSDVSLISLGGLLRKKELALCGTITKESLNDFCINKAFIGVGGLTIERGLSTYSRDSAEVVSAIIDRADKVILVADSSKFDKNVLSIIAPFNSIDVIVTDHGIPAHFIDDCKAMNIRLIMVDP